MPKDAEVEYVELFRVPITERTQVMCSKAFKEGKHVAYYVNEHVHTTKGYDGPTKGAWIPIDKWADFKAKINAIS